jgi:RimJ/RimL family protein N-acetyltransferase
MHEIPTLTTDRLRLRAFHEGDLDAYAAMCADPEVMRYIADGRPLDRAASWRSLGLMLGHWALRGYGQWALELKHDGRFVGRAGLWQPEGWPGLEVGWALTRSFWGQGLAREAGQAVLEFAWNRLQAETVISIIQPDNVASQRVAERLDLRLQQKRKLGDQAVLIFGRARPTT